MNHNLVEASCYPVLFLQQILGQDGMTFTTSSKNVFVEFGVKHIVKLVIEIYAYVGDFFALLLHQYRIVQIEVRKQSLG